MAVLREVRLNYLKSTAQNVTSPKRLLQKQTRFVLICI